MKYTVLLNSPKHSPRLVDIRGEFLTVLETFLKFVAYNREVESVS